MNKLMKLWKLTEFCFCLFIGQNEEQELVSLVNLFLAQLVKVSDFLDVCVLFL